MWYTEITNAYPDICQTAVYDFKNKDNKLIH